MFQYIISTSNQYKQLLMKYLTLFCFTKPAKSEAYSTLTVHLNLTILISSLQQANMASGRQIG